MENIIKVTLFISIALVFVAVDVFCNDRLYSRQGSYSYNNNNNEWPKLNSQNNYYGNPIWVNSSGGSTASSALLNQTLQNPVWFDQSRTSTPWPALGQRQPYQNSYPWANAGPLPSTSLTTNQNRPLAPSNQQPNFQNSPKVSYTGTDSTIERKNIDITDNDLRQFSENLLQQDPNNAANLVTINYQKQTTSRSTKDEAPEMLMTIHKDAFKIPTIAKLIVLHDNYIVQTNVAEQITDNEKYEENDFLDAILSTSVMEFTRNFLISTGKISSSLPDFKNKLKEIWFDMYARGGKRIGSSGFEHIFLGEIKNTEISGLHNWIYFDNEERNHRANYLGYLKKIDLGNKGAIVKLHFKYHDLDKPVGSMFIGTSPEFEMALYTTCFLLRPDRVCPLKLGEKRFIIRTYTYTYRGKKLIGSAFPEI